MASVCRWDLEQDDSYCLRDLCPQEGHVGTVTRGGLSPRLSSRVTSARSFRDSDGGLRFTWPWLTAPGRRRSTVESCVSQPLRFIRADPIKGGREINVTSNRPSVVMTCSMCGVREQDISCSAHVATREPASDSHMAKQAGFMASRDSRLGYDSKRLPPLRGGHFGPGGGSWSPRQTIPCPGPCPLLLLASCTTRG
jgi:hypothetical protein